MVLLSWAPIWEAMFPVLGMAYWAAAPNRGWVRPPIIEAAGNRVPIEPGGTESRAAEPNTRWDVGGSCGEDPRITVEGIGMLGGEVPRTRAPVDVANSRLVLDKGGPVRVPYLSLVAGSPETVAPYWGVFMAPAGPVDGSKKAGTLLSLAWYSTKLGSTSLRKFSAQL
mmetsp:Transcript_19762/g.48024  ORF Transcript_19762/g.48024 Transcript_19762/m.48024 type:complete len:168 (+) Transcript_19762:221-724(+)